MAKAKEEVSIMVQSNVPAIRSMSVLLQELGWTSVLKTTEEVLGEIIEVTGFQLRDGEYGEYMLLQGFKTTTGEEVKITCGGEVVMEKMTFVARMNAFPVACRFIKPGRYYDVE